MFLFVLFDAGDYPVVCTLYNKIMSFYTKLYWVPL